MLSSTDDKERPVASVRYPASLEDQSLQNGSIGVLLSGARPRRRVQALLGKLYGLGKSLIKVLEGIYRW